MNFDQMLETWRAQDEAPLHGVNRDLLQLVLGHEHSDLRRNLRWEQWSVYGSSVGLGALFAFFVAVVFYGDETIWDYVATGVATGAVLLWAGAFWVSRKRQALRERSFGNSLQEEIRRNLSLLDYQLSRHGRWAAQLLIISPILVAAVVILWFGARINENPFGWLDVGTAVALIVPTAFSVVFASRKAEQRLLPRRRRLSELLELLNASG
jgi:hypothetical protein